MSTGNDVPQGNIIGGSAELSGVVVQAGDVAGGIHTHIASRARPRPRQLPPQSRHFTDREDDLRALEELRTRGEDFAPRLIVVTGAAGMGKTALATRWLRELEEDYPDGHFYADLRGHRPESAAPPGEVLARFLRAMDVPTPLELDEQVALWRSATAGRRVAVLLDNAFTAAQVRPLLPSGAGSLAVVTCRRRLTALGTDGADFHPLGHLGPDAAVELLMHGIGEERMGGDAAAVERVVALCAGLPLALCLVSARLAARPRQAMRSMAEALDSEGQRLTVLDMEGEPAVRGVLDESYAALEPEVSALYRGLGLLPLHTFDVRVAAAVSDVPVSEAEVCLDRLVEANLLEEYGSDSYRFHDLVRLHAGERAEAEEASATCAAIVRRALDHRFAAVARAEGLLAPARRPLARDFTARDDLVPQFSGPPEALAWLDSERLNLMSLVREAAARGWHDAVWQLVDAMWPLFLRLRHYDQWIEAHEIGRTAASEAGNEVARRQMLTSGAAGLTSAGRLTDAIEWYALSLDSARVAGARRPEGQALLGLGACMFEVGSGEEGIPYLEEAILVWEDIGYVRGASLARIVLGEIALERGETQRAVESFALAHSTLRTVDDPHDEARALAFLGHAHRCAGKHDTGSAELARAIWEFTRAGSSHWRARALEMQGQGAERQGDPESAEAHYREALDLWVRLNPSDAERIVRRLAGLPRGE